MIAAFMPFLAVMIHERFDGATWLLPLLVAVGAVSVFWWRAFDDLRPYGWVQFFPILGVLMIVGLVRPRHSHEVLTLTAVIAAYAAAKAFETFDRETYFATHCLVSGYTLKHLFAAVAPLSIAIWIVMRRNADVSSATTTAPI